MFNPEGSPERESTMDSGDFSFGKLAYLKDETAYRVDMLKSYESELIESGINEGRIIYSKAHSLYKEKAAKAEYDLGEIRETLKDPINRGRLNLFMTLSAFEAKDLADKVMTFVSTLPPALQEPILRFAADNPTSLPLSLLCAFAMFFASKAVHFNESDEPLDSMIGTTGEPDAFNTANIMGIIELFNFEEHKN